MGWLRSWALAAVAVSASAAPHPAVLEGLVERARDLPPEFAADALLRIAGASTFTDVAWKREVLDDAFHLAASAQEPFARRNWTGRPGSVFDKAYMQGLDACTLQCRAVGAMLTVDYKKARELFGEIPPPQVPSLSCDDALVYDVSIFYATAGQVAARAFNAKETADEQPFHLLLRYASDVSSPAQVAPVARMIAGVSLKAEQFEALVNAFAGALAQLSGDDRSFSATVSADADSDLAGLPADCARRNINAQPLLGAWRVYVGRQLSGARCADSAARAAQPAADDGAKPASVDGKASIPGQCESPDCRQLSLQYAGLVVGPDGHGLTPEQKAGTEWGAKLRKFLSALADWTQDDDPVEFFQAKSRFYRDLFDLTPNGPERDLLQRALLAWLQQNGYQNEHRVEWFYPVNTLIIHTFADPAGMQATVRDLQRCGDPVISFYAQLEQLWPRSMEGTFGLL